MVVMCIIHVLCVLELSYFFYVIVNFIFHIRFNFYGLFIHTYENVCKLTYPCTFVYFSILFIGIINEYSLFYSIKIKEKILKYKGNFCPYRMKLLFFIYNFSWGSFSKVIKRDKNIY